MKSPAEAWQEEEVVLEHSSPYSLWGIVGRKATGNPATTSVNLFLGCDYLLLPVSLLALPAAICSSSSSH